MLPVTDRNNGGNMTTESRGRDAPHGSQRLYLAGPMRGIPEYNFPAFFAVAKNLRGLGYEVWSPAEHDVHADGFDPAKDTAQPMIHYMKRDLPAVLDADAVAVLPGWERSQGAMLEVTVARTCGIPVIDALTQAPLLETGATRELRGGCTCQDPEGMAKCWHTNGIPDCESAPPASPAATPRKPVERFMAWQHSYPTGSVEGLCVHANDYDTLEREVAELRGQNAEWLAANAPGGWIDELRGKLAEAQTRADDAQLSCVAAEEERELLRKRANAAESALATAKKDERERVAAHFDQTHEELWSPEIAERIRNLKGEA